MSIKNSIKPYYHYLYTTLKHADIKLHKHNEEELVNVIKEDIVRLDALFSLLMYVDGTMPLIRCQKAFASLKSEIEALYYLYREQKLIGHRHHTTLGWQIGKAIDLDLEIISREFKSKSHELYLNTVHTGEHAIASHISKLSEIKIVTGIMAYFTDCLEEIEEKNIDSELENIGYLIRGLLANLHFVAYIGNNKEKLENEKFFHILSDAVSIVKMLHIYQRTLKSIGVDNKIVGDLSLELQNEFDIKMKALLKEYDQITRLKDVILNYVRSTLIKNEEVVTDNTVRESIHARNLLHSYT